MSETFEIIIKDFCRLHNKSADYYLDFIARLNLPEDNIFIKRVVTVLVEDLEYGDSKFKWFDDSHAFQEIKSTLGDLQLILSRYSDNSFDTEFKVTKYPLGALLVYRSQMLKDSLRDIFIILRLYCLNLCIKAEGRELRSALRIATDLRTGFTKLAGKSTNQIDIYTTKSSFIDILTKSNHRLWYIQENFLLWIQSDAFYSIKKSSIGSRKINSEVIADTNNPELTRVVAIAPLESKQIDTNEISTFSDVSISIAMLPEADDDVDDPDDLTEVFQATASEAHPISLDGLNSIALIGCRLLTFQRLFLSLRSSVLDKQELRHFTLQLKNKLLGNDFKTRVIAIELCLIFIFAKGSNDIASMKISKVGDLDADLLLSAKLWRRRSIKMPNAKVAPPGCNYLNEVTDYCDLPLPCELINSLNSVMSADTCKFSDIQKCFKVSYDDTLAVLKDIFSKFSRRNTLQQIRASGFDYIAKQYDPGYAALLFANTEYSLPTPLYYKSATVGALAISYQEMLVEFGFSVTPLESISAQYTGSQLALNDAALSQLFSEIYEYINRLRNRALLSEQDSIAYFNNLSCFAVLVMIAATGHRTRHQFQFEPSHISSENYLLLLADKLCFDESAIRLIPLPSIASEMLSVFTKTSRRLSENILSPVIRAHLRQKEFWQHGLDEPLFTQIVDDKYLAVTSQDIQNFLKSFGFELPLNSFRHRLCSQLSKLNAHDFNQWFLGHIAEGEHPLNILSAMSISDISNSRSYMDKAIAPLNIKLPVALQTRGLPFISPKRITSVYVPPYLNVEYMNDRQRIRWCRDTYRSFTDDAQPYSGDIHEKILSVVVKLQNNADRHACQKLLLRMHERKIFRNELPVSQKWRGIFNERLVVIPTDFFAKQINVKSIRSLLFKKLTEALRRNEEITLNHVILSLVLSSVRAYQSLAFVRAFQENLSVVGDILYFHYLDKFKSNLQILDPLTVALLQRAPAKWSATKFTERSFIRFIEKISGEQVSVSSIVNFTQLIATYYLDSQEPSCIRAYRLGEFATTPLSESALVRFFTDNVYPVTHRFEKPAAVILTKIRASTIEPQIKEEFKFFSVFLKRVKYGFSRAGKLEIEFKQVIPKIWQEFVGSKSTNLNDLIDASAHLSDIAISVLIFMTDVGKRHGNGRKNIAYSTVDTYFTKICRPLLDAAGAESIFDYDSDELVELYQKVFENRELKTEARHVSILKDFHHIVSRSIQLADIDWSEIRVDDEEPVLRFSELCTYKDYSLALDLLMHDPFASSTERVIQQVILILACRFGLRRREIQHMLRDDVDFDHDTLSVLTNQYYRVKTPAGNRRLPISLLINGSESTTIKALQKISIKISPTARGKLFPVTEKIFLKLTNRVTEALKLVTENPLFRLYDCRHSFISHLMLAALVPEAGRLNSITNLWLREPALTFRRHWLDRMAGRFSLGNKLLHTVALVAGHTTAKTTINHYSHIFECLSFEYQMANLYKTKSELMSFLALIGMNPLSARKFLDRSLNCLALSVTEKLINHFPVGSILPVRSRHEVMLSERDLITSDIWFEDSLDILHRIRRLAAGKLASEQEIVDKLLRCEFFLKWPFLNLRKSETVVAEKKQLRSRVIAALNHKFIIEILKIFADKTDLERSSLVNLLKIGFFGTSRFFFDNSEIQRVSEVAEWYGFEMQIGELTNLKFSNVTRRGWPVSFSKNGLDIDYQLFLITLSLELS